MNLFIDQNNLIFRSLSKEYTHWCIYEKIAKEGWTLHSPWHEFLVYKNIGIVLKTNNLPFQYEITDKKKWLLYKLKYNL